MRSVVASSVPSTRRDGFWLVGIVAFFALTTRWLGWQAGIAATGGQDVHQYELMSRPAPGLPTSPVGSAYTARFFVHWSVGALADLAGVSVEVTYRVLGLVTVAGFVLVARLCLLRLGLVGRPLRLCLALAVLNPYALRYYMLVPGYLSDVVFQLGLAVALLGVLSRRSSTLLVGLVLAVLARQTIVAVAPVLAVWLLVTGRGRSGAGRRLTVAVAAVLLPVAALVLVHLVTRPFTTTFSPRFPADTVLPLVSRLPETIPVLGDHVLRILAPLLLVLSLLAALLVVHVRDRRPPAPEICFFALVAAAVVGQPLVIGPSFPGFAGNEPRLSALGFFPLVLCLAAAFRSSGLVLAGWKASTLLALVAVSSLHHIYTSVGPADASGFLVLQLVASVLAVVLVLAGSRSLSGPPDRSLPAVRSASTTKP
jgi:hypothetical protein